MLYFIQAWHKQHFDFIKYSLKYEGLTDNELFTDTSERIFWLCINKSKNTIYGFFGISLKESIYPVLEYFWIKQDERKKINNTLLKMIRFLKQFLLDNYINHIIFDVKHSDKFQYLSKFVRCMTKTSPYKITKNNSYFLIGVKDIKI